MDSRCVKNQRIFSLKRNVACRNSQIYGADFIKNYSPIADNVPLTLLLVLKIVYGLEAKVTDEKTSFLWGYLGEEVFMNCPKGLK